MFAALALSSVLLQAPLLGGPTPPFEEAREARDARDESVFLEWSLERDSFVLHEEIPLTLRMGFEERFLEEQLVPLFHRELDLPVQVQAPWWTNLADHGLARVAPEGRVEAANTFALEDEVASATRGPDRTIDGRRYRTFEWRTRLRGTSEADVALPPPLLRFAHATSFTEDFLGNRTAVDRRDGQVVGDALRFRIVRPPEVGRPVDYTGAVGRFTAEVDVTPRDVVVDEPLRVTWTVRGEGNHGAFEPPRLALPGFTQRAATTTTGRDDHGARWSTFSFELVPSRASVREVPELLFPYFDPDRGYANASAPSVPILVREEALDPDAFGASNRETPRVSTSYGTNEARSPLELAFAVVAASLGILAGGWILARRRAPRPASDAGAVPAVVHATALAVRDALADPEADAHAQLDRLLVAWLDLPRSAGVPHGDALRTRLVEAGCDAELAAQASELHDDLQRARYGGPDGSVSGAEDDSPRVLRLVEAVLRAR